MADAIWWYRVAGRQAGPVTWEALRAHVAEGLLQSSDPVWKTGLAEWVPAGTIEGLFDAPSPPDREAVQAASPPVTTHAGESMHFEGTRMDFMNRLASPWLRLAGQLLDGVVVYGIVLVGLGAIALVHSNGSDPTAPIGFFVLCYAVASAYLLLSDGLPGGQSLGKKLLGMYVIKERTQRPCGYGDSFLRNLLLGILGPIDWLFIFGAKRQRLGDKAAGTLVIKRAD